MELSGQDRAIHVAPCVPVARHSAPDAALAVLPSRQRQRGLGVLKRPEMPENVCLQHARS